MVGEGFVGLTESKLIYEEVSDADEVGKRISIEKRGYQDLFLLFNIQKLDCITITAGQPRFEGAQSKYPP